MLAITLPLAHLDCSNKQPDNVFSNYLNNRFYVLIFAKPQTEERKVLVTKYAANSSIVESKVVKVMIAKYNLNLEFSLNTEVSGIMYLFLEKVSSENKSSRGKQYWNEDHSVGDHSNSVGKHQGSTREQEDKSWLPSNDHMLSDLR